MLQRSLSWGLLVVGMVHHQARPTSYDRVGIVCIGGKLLLSDAAGEALIVAPWPAAAGAVDNEAVQHFEALQAVVKSIRNARAEYGVELGRKIPATICIAADSIRSGA